MKIVNGLVFDLENGFVERDLCTDGMLISENSADAQISDVGAVAASETTEPSVEQAISHINYVGSHHTDCIITENNENAVIFMEMVDSAGVYKNCSTRFADGFRYGFGAEVGISTSKLHARGPVGLEGMVTYKYKLYGDGHIVDDYATGKKSFHFKDI